MRNVVKKCKSQNWMAWVIGLVLGSICGTILYIFKTNKDLLSDIAALIVGVLCSCAFYYATLQSIWAKAHQKRYEIISQRELNHLFLIQKTLNSGDQEKSKELINKYRNSKYCVKTNFILVKGIYIGKFSTVINAINN